jgi:type II secretory pathway pseudopilin PulG
VRAKAHTARARAGFTIIEVVVAMGLFLLGMSSVLGLLAFGAALTRTAALRNDAAAAIETVMADLEEQIFPLVEEGGVMSVGLPQPIVDRTLPDRPDVSYSATATPDPAQKDYPGGALEYRIDVTMAWKSAGQSKQKKFTTLLLREIPFSERLRRQFVEKQ